MMRRITALTLVAALAAGVTSAQDGPPCDHSKSFGECFNRLLDAADARLAEEKEEAKARLPGEVKPEVEAGVEAKASPATNPGSSSALFSFLPGFAGALGIDGLSNTDGDLTFDKTFKLGGRWRLNVAGTAFPDAELFEPLREALPEEGSEQLVDELKVNIGDFDKVDFLARLTGQGELFGRLVGRDPKTYEPRVELWVKEFIESGVLEREAERAGPTPYYEWRSSDAVKAAIDLYPGGLSLLTDGIEQVAQDPPHGLGRAKVQALEESLVEVALATIRWLEDLDKRTLGPDFNRIDELIANQPQLIFEGGYNLREDLTGPDERSFSLCYEMGLSGNVNDFRSWAKSQAEQGVTECTPKSLPAVGTHYEYDCLKLYLESEPAMAMIGNESAAARSGHRLAIVARYSRTDPLDFSRPEQDFTFALDETEKLTFSLTYGRYFKSFQLPNLVSVYPGLGGEAVGNARFDLEAKYDDVTGDPMRQSRFVATLTVSQKMTDNTVLSLSAVYAEKPEYLGEVDEKVSANFGIKWKRDRPGGQN